MTAASRGFGRRFGYLTLGYAWFGRDAFRRVPLWDNPLTVLAAAEWRVAASHSLLMQDT